MAWMTFIQEHHAVMTHLCMGTQQLLTVVVRNQKQLYNPLHTSC